MTHEQQLVNFAISVLKYLEGEEDWEGDEIAAQAVDKELFTGPHEEAPEFRLVDWVWKYAPAEYTRPNITQKMRYDAEKSARELLTKYGFGNVNKIIGALAVENMRLVAEINEHRAARGIDPLPTFEV